MNDLFLLAAQNTVVALFAALFVYGLTRVWRNPPVAHLLWLLILLKLVAPPVARIEWTRFGPPALAPAQTIAVTSPVQGQGVDILPRFVVEATPRATVLPAIASAKERDFATSARSFWVESQRVLLVVWLGGTVICALIAATRIMQFERLVRGALPASKPLQRLTVETARKLGIRRVPEVRCVERVEVPLLWCAAGRPTIVLPMRSVARRDDQGLALILAHELAHLRRRDHWVRLVELAVSTICWWNPLVRFIRRRIHQAEDLCCDAWVRRTFPDCRRDYAKIVLDTAQLLTVSEVDVRLLPASPFLQSNSLKGRIEMILESRFAPSVSTSSKLLIAALAVLVLPSFYAATGSQVRADSKDEPALAARDTAFLAERFKYPVPFKIGRTETRDGGRVEIREVWGTRPRIEIGGQYLVRGRYVLPPGQPGKLYFYATAWGAWGKTASLDLQSAALDDQEGEFALVHGMAGPGAFHLRLTDAESYSRWFADVYFGNREKVAQAKAAGSNDEARVEDTIIQQAEGLSAKAKENLKRARETLERTDRLHRKGYVTKLQHVSRAFAVERAKLDLQVAELAAARLKATRNLTTKAPPTSGLPYAVKFEQGATRFEDGDEITILEIHGTAATFEPGNIYWINGTYKLASRDRASLAAYTTAMDAANGRSQSLKVQTTLVDRGTGTFTLFLPMTYRGWPHVSFYPASGGEGFGGNYFGTGDSVLKRWWGEKQED